MIRTQVQLTDEQLRGLRRLSSVTGNSISELVRRGVELYLNAQRQPQRKEQMARALRIAGKFSSGTKNVSRDHDDYLSEAFKG